MTFSPKAFLRLNALESPTAIIDIGMAASKTCPTFNPRKAAGPYRDFRIDFVRTEKRLVFLARFQLPECVFGKAYFFLFVIVHDFSIRISMVLVLDTNLKKFFFENFFKKIQSCFYQ